jgi:hypothetical protein
MAARSAARPDRPYARTRAAFDAAIHANPYVVSYLLDPDSIPVDRPPHFALYSREETAYVAETLVDAFAATDGALEWLATQAPPSPLASQARTTPIGTPRRTRHGSRRCAPSRCEFAIVMLA